MSEAQGRKPTKSVWQFVARAIGCSVGVPPSLQKEFDEEFPPARHGDPGHPFRDLVQPMKLPRGAAPLFIGAAKVLCEDGMFAHAVSSMKKFVLCRDRDVAKQLGIRTVDMVCKACFGLGAEVAAACKHDGTGEGNFLGFYGLRQVLHDVTHEGFDDLEIIGVQHEAAGKALAAKDAQVLRAKTLQGEAEAKREEAEKEIIALKKQLDAQKADHAAQLLATKKDIKKGAQI